MEKEFAALPAPAQRLLGSSTGALVLGPLWLLWHGAWRTAQAVYLYINATQAYLLPAEEIPGGVDAAWTLLGEHLPAEKLHVTR